MFTTLPLERLFRETAEFSNIAIELQKMQAFQLFCF